MAVVKNERDVILDAAASRIVQTASNAIEAQYSATSFSVNNGVATPATITITAVLKGQLYGTPTFSIISGISSIDTSTPGTAVLSYSNMTADTCRIRISLVFFGTTYTTDCVIEGKNLRPSQVASITTAAEFTKLRLSWNLNPEADISGYEVRTTDTGWGTAGYVYRGAGTSCLVNPGALGVATTWYVRAFDSSNLYSATSRTVSYTLARPATVTGVAHSFSQTLTNSEVLISWTVSTPAHGFKQYRVLFTPPAGYGSAFSRTVLNPFITLPANWVGNATVNVFVTDLLNNESLASTNYTAAKVVPTTPTGVSVVPYSTDLLVDWADNTIPTNGLPIAGYEVRKNNGTWGTKDSNLVWRGSASKITIDNPTPGAANTYYINAFDTDGRYAATGATASYTVLAPANVSNVLYTFYDTSTTSATVELTWTPPATTSFTPSKYEVSITKPPSVIPEVVTVDSTKLMLQANWVGNAPLVIKTIDVLDQKSSGTATINIPKLVPVAPTGFSAAVQGKTIALTWAASVKTTLPISHYEIRSVDSPAGIWAAGNTTGLLWKGDGTLANISTFALGVNNFYIRAVDTEGVYSTSSATVSITLSAPGSLEVAEYVYSAGATGVTSTISWEKPTGSFDLDYYLLTITKPTPATPYTVRSLTNEYSMTVDWVADTTVTIVAYDVVGNTSPLADVVMPKAPPETPGIVTTFVGNKSLTFDWPDTVQGSLPIVGYEIRSDNVNWGSPGYVWRGSSSKTEITSAPVGAQTWYLRAYDTARQYSAASRTISFTVAAPGASTAPAVDHIKYQDTSTTGATVTVTWTPQPGTFAIEYFMVNITKPGGLNPVVANMSTNTFTFAADWVGAASMTVRAVDYAGNQGALFTIPITKTAPAASTGYTKTVGTNSITFRWNEAVKGSLPVFGYEIRPDTSAPGTTGYLWKGSVTSATFTNFVEGVNNFYLWTIDTDGKYSATSLLLTHTITKPSTIIIDTANSKLNTSLTAATAIFKWNPPSSSEFGVQYYEVSLTTASDATPASRVTLNVRNTTDWDVPADWVGNATFSVTAVDRLGIKSVPATYVLAKAVPNQPGVFLTPRVTGTSLLLDWPDTATATNGLPIIGYELRSADTGWGASGFIWKGNASSASVDLAGQAPGNKVWYLKAIDTDDRYSSTARSYTYSLTAPPNTASASVTFNDTLLTSATVTVQWVDTSPVFGVKHYEIDGTLTVTATTTASNTLVTVSSTKGIRPGDVVSSANIPSKIVASILSPTQLYLTNATGVTAATSISTTFTRILYSNSTTLTLPADWLGDKIYTIKTVDLLGNYSVGRAVTATKLVPSQVSNFRAQIIDNTVLLYWDLPAPTTLPIAHVRLKKGASWEGGTSIGDKDGTFTTITELQAGTYTYWIAVVDTDNNESTPVSLAATVSQPPDYIFNAEWQTTFADTAYSDVTLSNAVLDTNNNSLILPANTAETFAAHFTTPGWASPDAQIAAGFPIYIQPGINSGYYEEVFDYGQLLGASQVSVAISGENISGNPIVSTVISTSSDGIAYPNEFPSTSAFATSFRYIKVRITVTQAVAGNLYRINAVTVRLDAKQKTDSGSSTIILGGAHVQGNIAPDYIDTWIAGGALTNNGFASSFNGTAAENVLEYASGPSGLSEVVWSCIDADIGSDSDGGWHSLYVPADFSKGHLFACFVQKTTASGSAYWGTNQNSTLSTLAGTLTSNPYFWVGTPPLLNTWYLMVGYVYPTGHGTTDNGISGLYDLSGTKIITGSSASFKHTSGTSIMHRAYHFYNATNSGQIVQRMARPIIVECAAADATSMINYILQCATDPGVSVKPNNQFIDIVSITATPSSLPVGTPVVDFLDIPAPKRFNIFKYSNAGALQEGTVSWTVRGY